MTYNDFLEEHGTQFENLFSDLMRERYGNDYQPTSTNGPDGDLSVDGVLSFETAFAVYAPECYSDSKTCSKLRHDFEGFLERRNKGYWKFIKQYIFVVKRIRKGMTATVLNLIGEFNDADKNLSVNIIGLDTIKNLLEGPLPFSQDGNLLQEFKNDVVETMEYVINYDFASQLIKISLPEEIDEIKEKWEKKQNSFQSKNYEKLKTDIVSLLCALLKYMQEPYMCIRKYQPNIYYFIFKKEKDTLEELRSKTNRIRRDLLKLYMQLWQI